MSEEPATARDRRTEIHAVAWQTVAELDRWLQLADREIRSAKFTDARADVRFARDLLKVLDRALRELR